MNKLWILLLFLLCSCSFDTKSGIWTQDKEIKSATKNVKKLFQNEKKQIKELNSNFKIKINSSNILLNKNINLDNNSSLSYFDNGLSKMSKFKFSKIENFNYFEPDLVSDGNDIVFFDDKSNLIKFDKTKKILWKKNFYKKSEKKLKPILTLSLNKNNLIVADSIGKIYNVNFTSGDLNWTVTNPNPFNSQLKIYQNKIYVIDMNNTLRCYSLSNGKELWNFKSENSFLKSNKRNSLAIKNEKIYFNNSLGDITTIDANTGDLIWQIPTQSSSIYENAFGLRMSDLVISEEDLIFSNNRNEFYSLSLVNGILNWKQDINSSVRPVVINNLIFTFSNNGYFFLIDKKTGNIIRITNIFKNIKKKSRPIGFVVGKENVLLSTDKGQLLVIDIETGTLTSILKIDQGVISRPFIFNKKVFLLKDNSVIKLN